MQPRTIAIGPVWQASDYSSLPESICGSLLCHQEETTMRGSAACESQRLELIKNSRNIFLIIRNNRP
jgi:hypothetical protein